MQQIIVVIDEDGNSSVDLNGFTDGSCSKVRHPPRSGWLDGLGRLKGGWSMGLGVARCAPYGLISELSCCSIRRVLLADVCADLLQFEPHG